MALAIAAEPRQSCEVAVRTVQPTQRLARRSAASAASAVVVRTHEGVALRMAEELE